MAFDRQFLLPIGSTADGLTRWKYSHPSDLLSAVINTATYFDGANDLIKAGDSVVLDLIDGGGETNIISTLNTGEVRFDQTPYLSGTGSGGGIVSLTAQQNAADVRVIPTGGGTAAIIQPATGTSAGAMSPSQALQLSMLGTASQRNVGLTQGDLVELNVAGQFPASVIPGGGGAVNLLGPTFNISKVYDPVVDAGVFTRFDVTTQAVQLTLPDITSLAGVVEFYSRVNLPNFPASITAAVPGQLRSDNGRTAHDNQADTLFIGWSQASQASCTVHVWSDTTAGVWQVTGQFRDALAGDIRFDVAGGAVSFAVVQKTNGQTLDLSRVNEVANGAIVTVPTASITGDVFAVMLAEGGTSATVGAPINQTLTTPLEQLNFRWDGTTWDRYGSITGGGGGGLGANTVGPNELQSTTVTPGSFTNANITVDADGRLTAASNGTGGGAPIDLRIVAKADGETLDLTRVNEVADSATVTPPTATVFGDIFAAMLAEGGSTATIGTPINQALTTPLEQINYRWDGTTWDRYGLLGGGGGSSVNLDIVQKADGETLDLSRVNEVADGATATAPTATAIGNIFGVMLAEGGTTATIGAPINATLTTPLEQQNFRWDGTTWDRYGSISSGGGGSLGPNTVGPTELQSTTVTPGSFTSANITVDADGRLTAASNGAGGSSSTLGPTFTAALTTYNPTTHAGDFLALDATSNAVVLVLPDVATVPDATNFWIRGVSNFFDCSLQAAVPGQVRANNGYSAHSVGADQVFLGLSRDGSPSSWAKVWAQGNRWIIAGQVRSGSNDDFRYDSLSAIPDNLITSAKLNDDVGRYGTNNDRAGTFNLVQTDENEMIIWTGAAGDVCNVLDAAPGSQFVIKRDSTDAGTLQVVGATRLRFENTPTTTFALNPGKTVTLVSRANSAPLIIDVLGGA